MSYVQNKISSKCSQLYGYPTIQCHNFQSWTPLWHDSTRGHKLPHVAPMLLEHLDGYFENKIDGREHKYLQVFI